MDSSLLHITCENCYTFKVIHCSVAYYNKIGKHRRKNKEIVVPHTTEYSAVIKREVDMYLLIWKDLQVEKYVCVKYMCIYLLVCL